MKTDYVLKSIPERYGRDVGNPAAAGPLARSITAGAIRQTNLEQSASQKARRDARARVVEQFQEGRLKFTADTQPRDSAGKFRRVLARLKLNLGKSVSEQLSKEMEEAAAAGEIGNYELAKTHAAEVIKLVDEVDTKDMAKGSADNIRKGAESLGKMMAYLPLPQGKDSAKVRFSDLPTPTAELIKNLIDQVQQQLGEVAAADITSVLRGFMSGMRTMSSDQMASELTKIMNALV